MKLGKTTLNTWYNVTRAELLDQPNSLAYIGAFIRPSQLSKPTLERDTFLPSTQASPTNHVVYIAFPYPC